ncbi:MBL fold metallo-hydrolase [Rhabdobacter roseus]|uniref:Glyoxylase-like metal-dependent hydrolase (Beta-lactamase superfamily II) n=1 Tax=Rhabdobacter roseus TaxID=1655419 RepID=A0A840TNT8_9BACT|nr:MBL fold metallo-hydrolase [Rhabdobacter roseus]MBB5283417.1 glyoxylase-like metal-dependent hydrolase (beta-lactamase superfamily II) [Rhabdobacter roseus]
MQVLKNLYQVGGDLNGITFDQPGALWNDGNSYILKTPEGLLLFDCGCGDTLEQIFANMRYWDLPPEEIRYCLLTHPHYDHAGGAHLLKQRGVKLVAIRQTAEAVAAGDERCCGYLYHKEFTPVTVDQLVTDGQTLSLLGVDIEVMHLPGHSMGCTAFFFTLDQRRIVISGDVIGTLLSGDFGWSGSIDFDKKIYTESLRKFARVDTDLMLPGHGMIYFHKPRWRVEEALNAALMQWR